MSRGNERRDIFRHDRDRAHFLELLGVLPGRFGMLIHAFVLMNNHYHLVLEVPGGNLSQALQWLNVSYSAWFNRRHQRTGHLFQGRFKSHLIESDAGVAEVARYVHLNPVRTGRFKLGKPARVARRRIATVAPDADLVARRIAFLRDYQWSSYPAYRGWKPVPDWLTTDLVGSVCGGRSVGERREGLRRYVEDPIRDGVFESPWEQLIGGEVLGSEEFYRSVLSMAGDRSSSSAKANSRFATVAPPPTWGRIVQVVESRKGEAWKEFCDRHGDWGRDAALYLGRHLGRLTLAELGKRAGGLPYAVVGTAISRFAKRADAEPEVRKAVEGMKDQLSKM